MPESIPRRSSSTRSRTRFARHAPRSPPRVSAHATTTSADPQRSGHAQKSVLAALDKERTLRVLTCSTRGRGQRDRGGVVDGRRAVRADDPACGLYASVNTLRGVAWTGRVPIFYMIGLLQREKDKEPRESRHSMCAMRAVCSTCSACRTRARGARRRALIPEYYRLAQNAAGRPRCSSPGDRVDGHEGPRKRCARSPPRAAMRCACRR